MTKTSKRRFAYKLDMIFWFIVMMLPLITYFIVSYRQGNAVEFLTYVSNFSPFPFIADIFDSVLTTAFGHSFQIVPLIAYFVGVEIIHVLFDVVVFIPRLAHKWVSIAVQDD